MTSPGFVRVLVAQLLLLSALCAGTFAQASSPADDSAKVTETVRMMFDALVTDDLDLFRSVTSPDFYAFDGGQRFDGDELLELIKDLHASGKVYVWEITEPNVRVVGDTAWITYVNRGSVSDATGKQERSWLESAVLLNQDGTWRIQFFHSTRVESK